MASDELSFDRRDFRARRSLLIVPPLVGLVVVAVGIGANRGAIALVVMALILVSLVALLIALTWRLSIVDTRLQAAGRPPFASAPAGGVDLHALSKVSSVGYRYGLFLRLGPPLFRPLIVLQDTHGGEAWISAWGWEDKKALMTLLRQAVLISHAKMDPLTFWRLGFKPSGNRQVSRWRRLL